MEIEMANSEVRKVVWTGKSGKRYEYFIYEIGTEFSAVPGNYIYSKLNSNGKWVAVYVGETENLKNRDLESHHQKDCIKRNGATHIHVHKSSTVKSVRLDEETDLRANYNPTCNKQ